jgi:hypothetical protein
MNPWREVLKALQAELDRLSQEIEGRSVLPNGVTAVLPAARFERWAPILAAVAAELGEALVEWVAASRRTWYAGAGPYLTVRLDAERTQSEISCHFLESPPGERPATAAEPLAQAAVAVEPVAAPPRVAPAASWEPALRGDADRGTEVGASALDRFELDAPGEEPASRRRSRQDDGVGLSEIELD